MAPRARLVQRAVSRDIRDGLLQDMVAMGIMTQALRARLQGDEEGEQLRMLDTLSDTLATGAERLRGETMPYAPAIATGAALALLLAR